MLLKIVIAQPLHGCCRKDGQGSLVSIMSPAHFCQQALWGGFRATWKPFCYAPGHARERLHGEFSYTVQYQIWSFLAKIIITLSNMRKSGRVSKEKHSHLQSDKDVRWGILHTIPTEIISHLNLPTYHKSSHLQLVSLLAKCPQAW